jgi:hypothetical protein
VSRLPFRWNVARREQLGALVRGDPSTSYAGFVDELREMCARLVAAAGDRELVFIGRSLESAFDYLSGIFAESGWADRCVLLNLSMRYQSAGELARENPAALQAMREQLEALGLSPSQIASGRSGRSLLDLVYGASTFGNLTGLLLHLCEADQVDPAAVVRRLRLVGVTIREKNSPNTWRWYQKAEWAGRFPRRALRSVSAPYGLWSYLGNTQSKVSRWHPPTVWGTELPAEPPREAEHLEALRLALYLHERGRDDEERALFARALTRQREMREPWLRRLVLELRSR